MSNPSSSFAQANDGQCTDGSVARVARAALALLPLHRIGALSALLLVVACAQLPERPSSGPIADIAADVAPASGERLSPVYGRVAARADTAERVWQLVNERFYDPATNGVDWERARRQHVPRVMAAQSDAEMYRALKSMVAELHDSHTIVLTPREALDRRRYATTRVGITPTYVDGRVVVADVDPNSPAAKASIAPGDVIDAINGRRVDESFVRAVLAQAPQPGDAGLGDGGIALPEGEAEAERVRVLRAVMRLVRPINGVTAPTPLRFELRNDSGVRQVELRAAPVLRPPIATSQWLDDGVLLIKFTRFLPEVRAQIDAALDEATRARAIVIDLRGNSGGLIEMFSWFCGQFVADERIVMRSMKRDREQPGAQNVSLVRIWPPRIEPATGESVRPPLLQPLAVLIDARTASAAELAAVTLAEQRSALLVGEPTCGCAVGVPTEYVLPDQGGLRISETGYLSARGRRMEGRPTAPDLRVQPQIADLRAGRDAVLEAAHRALLVRLAETGFRQQESGSR